jgi:DNA repair protein RadA/Sms
MAKLKEIQYEHHDFMKLSGIPWFAEAANHPGLARGGIYLLSGPPGAGKTTIALQVATDLASRGRKVLYLALEQSPSDIKQKIDKQVFPHRKGLKLSQKEQFDSLKEGLKKVDQQLQKKNEEETIEEHFYIDSNVSGMEALPDFLARKVLGAGRYEDVELIIVDSIQGLGTAPTSSKPYQKLFEFNRWAKEQGITVLLIGHITKGGAIAGPRSLEHNVDCVFYLRKAMRLRPLFVPKNRFGPERHEPLTLIMDANGCLEKSKHVKARASHAFGFIPSSLIEVQALVKLPKYGDKPGIKAPYLPRQKLSQLVGTISNMHEIDISDLTFEINCAIPGGLPYRTTIDLPLSISMLSSYFQRQIPLGSLFVGELDLFQTIRPISDQVCSGLAEVMIPSETSPLAYSIRRLYISQENEASMRELLLQQQASDIDVRGIQTLENLVEMLWPDIVEKPSDKNG